MLHHLTFGRNIPRKGGDDYVTDVDWQMYCDVFETIQFAKLNEQVIAQRILNHELAEYTTKVSIYTPSGDKIIFK